MPTLSGYNPSSSTPSLGALVAASTGAAHSTSQEYTVAVSWLAVLQRAAEHMQVTPRLRREGVALAKAVASATGGISAATAGSMVTIPAAVLARLARSSAKHVRTVARLKADTEVKEVDRPLPLLTDTSVSDPKTASLLVKAGVASTTTLDLSTDSVVSGEEVLKLKTLVVVLAEQAASCDADATVEEQNVVVDLTSETAVEAASEVSIAADSAVQVEGTAESVDADTAVQEEAALSLLAKAGIQTTDLTVALSVASAIQASTGAPISLSAAIARTSRREMGADSFVVFSSTGELSLDMDAVIQFVSESSLDADCSVEESFDPVLNLSSDLVTSVYVMLPGQLDADVYVVPLPKATWIFAKTAVLALDQAALVSADTFIVP